MTLKVGLSATHTHIVSRRDLALHWGGEVPVLSSPTLIGLLEQTCMLAADHELPAGKTTVGIGFDFLHLAPSPEEELVILSATLRDISGNQLQFYVEARDSKGLISSGKHIRGIVDRQRFIDKIGRRNVGSPH